MDYINDENSLMEIFMVDGSFSYPTTIMSNNVKTHRPLVLGRMQYNKLKLRQLFHFTIMCEVLSSIII